MTPEQARALGRVEQKITDMCITNTKEHKEIKDIIDVIQISRETRELACSAKFERRPTNKIFYWVLSGVFGMLFFLFGMMINIDQKIDVHVGYAKDAYHQITGRVYQPTIHKNVYIPIVEKKEK